VHIHLQFIYVQKCGRTGEKVAAPSPAVLNNRKEARDILRNVFYYVKGAEVRGNLQYEV